MSSDLPPPLIAADVDLRTFDCMPLDVVKLLNSNLVFEASAEEFRAAVLLWARAWHQVPAGSLPDDEKTLARMAHVTPRLWKRLCKGALRGFVKCSDGRLYHPVICEFSLKSWGQKLTAKRAANSRWGSPNGLENHESRNADAYAGRHAQGHAEPMPRTEQNRNKKKKDGAGGFLERAGREADGSKRPWSLDEKRAFAWQRVAEAIGDGGWDVVTAAAEGDVEAKQRCKAIAKQIEVTWYDGKPAITPVSA